MPKPHVENSSGVTTDSHSKKWFTKISLKIPKKLKNQKNASTLTNALNNAKKNNALDSPTKLSQCDNSISNQTIYENLGETNSISSNTLIAQPTQLTIESKNENTLNSNNTPVICISTISNDSTVDNDTNNTLTKNIDINSNTVCSIRRSNGLGPSSRGHRRTSSDYINTPAQRPRSYSDTPVPVHPSVLYYDDDYDTKSYEIPENLRQQNKESYYHEKDLDLYDKTPVITTHNTPIDTSNFPTPSNTVKVRSRRQNESAGNTPVLRHHEVVPSHTPENKYNDFVDTMQNKSCDKMTAKEFAMAVGLRICAENSDSEDDDCEDDKNSICTLSSTLSQLTANGKVPTANEIYNALSVKSLGRQKRKQSAPILNLDMFNPPTPGECLKSASSCHSFKTDLNSPCPRAMGDLSHKSSNPKLEKRLPPCISTSKSNESNLTCVASKYSSTSSIHSSHSGNTTSYIDLPDNDCDSYCSCTSYLQQSMNGSPELNKNNISTTFYSLPRVTFHSAINSSPITASKSTNSIPTSSNFYVPNYNSYRDMGCSGRRHSRVSSSISINSQSSSVKKAPSSPISVTPSPTLPSSNSSYLNISSPNANANINTNANKTSAIDAQNMYINSKTIATSTTTRAINTPSPTNYPTSSSWSNGLNDIENLRLTAKNPVVPKQAKNENKVEVYTKGRFTITHETFSHSRKASTHKFQVEKN